MPILHWLIPPTRQQNMEPDKHCQRTLERIDPYVVVPKSWKFHHRPRTHPRLGISPQLVTVCSNVYNSMQPKISAEEALGELCQGARPPLKFA